MELIEVPGGHGKAVAIRKGQRLKLINTFGGQTVDFWALSWNDTSEFMSVEHSRRLLGKLFPQQGDILLTNRRAQMLLIEEDTSGAIHDTLCPACDKWMYKYYGCAPGHRNCRDNFMEALFEAGFDATAVPNPLNIWMNVAITHDSAMELKRPTTKPGDTMVLKALMDCILIMSACPMDITPVNGGDGTPRPVHYTLI
ncbi:DUF1989 domain-containing protein [Aestuariivirga litoralis]|uniref:DUF1989 domain-containing protein n=1 Tax=Aestuariivirga litoralis TaxID=2650924 RepID=UPI0018C5F2C8|nr:urea carboxylase-associated family protein [Aestuariivirga litoralis]MBG1233411.1 urea carboxylase-associated family protein [Aestuariivirga litoralis]